MGQSRKEKAREFERQLYLAASFFKMTSFSDGSQANGPALDPAKLEKRVNDSVRVEQLQNFPHPAATRQVIPPRVPWEKHPRIARGEEVTRINRENDTRLQLGEDGLHQGGTEAGGQARREA